MAATFNDVDKMCDGFDWGSGSEMALLHGSITGTPAVVQGASTPYNYGQAISGNFAIFDSLAPGGGNKETWEYAAKVQAVSNSTTFFSILHGPGGQVLGVQRRTDGFLEVFRAVSAEGGALTQSLGASATAVMPSLNAWYWLVVIYYVHNSAGVVKVFVGDVTTPVISITGVDTQVAANAFATQHQANGSNIFRIDDYHLMCGTGSPVDADALPDSRVITSYTASDGTNLQFSLNTGASHAAVYRDVPVSSPAGVGDFDTDDTTYGFSQTAGDRESMFVDGFVTGLGTINFFQGVALIKKTDASARSVRLFTKRAGTTNVTVDGAIQLALDNYVLLRYVKSTDPHPTSPAAWASGTILNATELGVKIEV